MPRERIRQLGCAVMGVVLSAAAVGFAAERPALPPNLAAQAKISADSEYSDAYRARFIADDVVPPAGSHADLNGAWCVNGNTHRNGATLTLEWPNPVTIAEVVYYGRTAWFANECWNGYELRIDGAAKPVAAGTLRMGHGPQRIRLASPVRARTLAIRFTGSYGGPNPGASELQVFATPPAASALPRFIAMGDGEAIREIPGTEEASVSALRSLIADLSRLHGPAYARAAAHRAQLDRLTPGADAGEEALKSLQREALLFDVDDVVTIKRHEIEASHVYTYHYEGFRPGGGLYVHSLRDPSKPPRELVASPTGQILDCDLSYDGKLVLFSWRQKADDGYHLWTINVDGTNLKRITDGPWHDYNACWLPDGGIGFLSSRSAQFAYCWHAPVGVLYRMDADGRNVRLLSGNYLNDFTPYPLDDGRIIYTRWEYVDRPAIPIQSLWTINPDGAGLSGYFGNRVISPATFMDARSVPGSTAILCTMTGHNGPSRGAIGLIDRHWGDNAQASITNLTPDVPVPAVNDGNGNTDGTKLYSCPVPLDSMRFLASARGPVIVRDIAGSCISIALPAPSGGMQYFSTQPIRPRRRPPVLASTLPPAGEAPPSAVLYLRDVYQGLEPIIKRGEVVKLRIVREMPKTVRIDPDKRAFGFQFPVISCGATYAGKDVLGEVRVNSDGSAAFRVPTGLPIYFMALDAQGRAVQRMRSFTHLMPGETQGCVGCHEPRNQSPPGHARIAALSQEIQELEPPEWGRGGFDYSRIVQPVLDRYCVECHDPVKAPRGVDLSGGKTDFFSVSYETLARGRKGPPGEEYDNPYTSWIPTYNGHEQNILKFVPKSWGSPQSKLAEIVLSNHPDDQGKPRFNMDEASRRRILAWIDLNVPYYGSSETAYPENKGCRWIYPATLDRSLAEVAQRRCASCHSGGKIPRRTWTRITEPQFNPFLLAPLAKNAGGTEACGKAVFASTADPDYRAILKTFEPVTEMLAKRPRMDMPGGKPAPDVCRDRK